MKITFLNVKTHLFIFWHNLNICLNSYKLQTKDYQSQIQKVWNKCKVNNYMYEITKYLEINIEIKI